MPMPKTAPSRPASAAGHALARATLALGLLLGAAAGAQAADPACRVVLGGGGSASIPAGTDADFWNRLNFPFYDAGQYALSQTDRTAEGRFHLVGSPEAARSTEVALKAAQEQGCDEVVRLSVYGDDTAHPMEVVFRIVVRPVQRGKGGPALGDPVYQHEYRYPVDEDVEREVHPAELGGRAVADYLAAAGGR